MKKSPVTFKEMDKMHYYTLNEYQKRHYLATLVVGGVCASVRAVCAFFHASKNTVYKAISEILAGYMPEDGRTRRKGGGAKSKLSKNPHWMEVFNEIVEEHKMGLPQDEMVIWLDINTTQIMREFEKRGIEVSCYIVEQMIAAAGLRKRSFAKSLPMGEAADRDAQFQKINKITDRCASGGIPVISVDTKKKESVGNFKREGEVICNGQPKALDHDFANETIVPHGIYDVEANTGYLAIGNSHDTSEFFCDHVAKVWTDHLQWRYSDADTLVILCDGGGSNSSRHHIVKQDLLDLSARLGIKILMLHYPPYCSKHNPIEHRLFSQITRSWNGSPLTSALNACKRAANTVTKTGLKVYSYISRKQYETKRALRDSLKEEISRRIIFDDKLPDWNYLILPS